jgi:hypothetical protein
MSDRSTSVNVGCVGCVPIILALIVLWGLIFGVNYGGQHHQIGCGNNGVDIR